MSKFYGTVMGAADTAATRRGHDCIRVSAQSWNGSVITQMYYGEDGKLRVSIETDNGSSCAGTTKFDGTYEQFLEQLRK